MSCRATLPLPASVKTTLLDWLAAGAACATPAPAGFDAGNGNRPPGEFVPLN